MFSPSDILYMPFIIYFEVSLFLERLSTTKSIATINKPSKEIRNGHAFSPCTQILCIVIIMMNYYNTYYKRISL